MPIKGKSFEEIIKTEMDAGRSQAQALAIAYKEHPEKNNDLSARNRFDSLSMRTQRGTERYASIKREDQNFQNEDDNIEGRTRIDEPKPYQNSLRLSLHGQAIEGKFKDLKEALKIRGYKTEKEFADAGFEWWEDGRSNEDEASQEEHEIQMSEIERKKEMNPKGNCVTVRIVNDTKRQKILDAIQKLIIKRVDAARQSDNERVKEIEEEIDNLESQL